MSANVCRQLSANVPEASARAWHFSSDARLLQTAGTHRPFCSYSRIIYSSLVGTAEIRVFPEHAVSTFGSLSEKVGVLVEIGESELGQAALAHPEQVSRSSCFQVLFRYVKTVCVLLQDFQTFRFFLTRVKKNAVGLVFSSSHPAPQLVQLGEAEALGILDKDHSGVGDVDPHLDDGSGDQDICGSGGKTFSISCPSPSSTAGQIT